MKKYLVMLIVLSMLLTMPFASNTFAQPENSEEFIDVPRDSWAKEYIYKLKELNIANGKGNGIFGYDDHITRAEFLTFLVRILGIDINNQERSDVFSDVKLTDWYYPYVNAGLKNSIIVAEEYLGNKFEPGKDITREEMAVMIVRALQYDYLAQLLGAEPEIIQFKDVQSYKGYIAVAKDFGIITGKNAHSFAPQGNALRQEAAAMLVRMYNVLNHKIQSLNGFYAIKAYPQINKMNVFDTVSFGWSRLEYNAKTGLVELATNFQTNKDFWIPEAFEEPIAEAEKNRLKKYIMVFATNENKVNINNENIGLISLLLSNHQSVQNVKESIINLVNNMQKDGVTLNFDGVVVDFEALKDSGEDKKRFVDFLSELKQELDKKDKELIVSVNPKRQPEQVFYDGYDFKSIGEIADKVILMAHDYEPKKLREEEISYFTSETPTPLAPIKDIYYALKYAVDPQTGIPRDKLVLQINFGTAQWNFKDGKLENTVPYTLSSYQILKDRMTDGSIKDKQFKYSNTMQSPTFTFTDPNTGVKKVIWYEDYRSVEAKIRMAKIFGINGISVWRLGIVPDFEDSQQQEQPHYLNLWPLFESISKLLF
ncbi:MAG: hypothetical protein PWR27_291 [Petroclostridium sp.]|jgi:spore germination protein YaaH|nr:hypothetical protein [Petroclostridium sp.]